MLHLLDTNVLLWIVNDEPRAPKELLTQLTTFGASFAIHQASLWEIQIKFDSGKLALPSSPEEVFASILSNSGVEFHRFENETIFGLDGLKPIHKDPFDRIIASHCLIHNLPLVTSDRVFLEYGVNALIPNA